MNLRLMGFFNGGRNVVDSKLGFPPAELTDFIPFFHTPLYFDGSFLHQKYVVEAHSVAQIADEIFSSKSTVLKALKSHHIKTRGPHKPHGFKAQHRYGERRIGNRTAVHRREEAAIGAIKQLIERGFSLREICSCLNRLKIPTKNRAAKWHPMMIKRIMDFAKSKRVENQDCPT